MKAKLQAIYWFCIGVGLRGSAFVPAVYDTVGEKAGVAALGFQIGGLLIAIALGFCLRWEVV